MSVSSALIPAADADLSGRTIQHSAESGAQRTGVDRKVFFCLGAAGAFPTYAGNGRKAVLKKRQ